MKKYLLLLLGICAVVFYSCEKKDTEPSTQTETEQTDDHWDLSAESYLKDSTLYITKLYSLWQDYISPANINDILDSTKLRAITSEFENAEQVMAYLTAQTPKDPATGMPIDRFSFIDRQGAVSEEIQNARTTSYGLYTIFLQTQESQKDNNNAYLYIRMVDQGSQASLAGIQRGDRILSINGNTKYDYNTQLAQDFKGLLDALNSESMTLKVQKPDGTVLEKTISSTSYSINPIINPSIGTIEGENIAYFGFSSFLSIQPGGSLEQAFNTYFNEFESANVKHLIVDLRYNGGGATLTAEYLANRIAPSSANKKTMYTYKTNALLHEALGDDFEPVLFQKIGNLELETVYFLVTGSTASASELLINSLKPYMDVQIIGTENTYGKPVGFWGIPTGKPEARADVYAVSFQTLNATGFGDYYSGLKPDKISYEGYLNDFGDVNEGLLREAIYHITNGHYSAAMKSNATENLMALPKERRNFKQQNKFSDMGMFKFAGQKINE